MKIAIIGSGISGLTCAYYLGPHHQVTFFEKNATLGGHTNTVAHTINGKTYHFDTAFMVFNKKTYPHFTALLEKENIAVEKTDMSFSFQDRALNVEYNGHSIWGMLGYHGNWRKSKMYQLLWNIFRFNLIAKKTVRQEKFAPTKLTHYLAQHGSAAFFQSAYFSYGKY